MAEKEKVKTMVLNVDLQCSKCYKKVKKLLCKFPEIRDQTYDEKANKVTIKVVCCSPEKIRDKLCCKGGGSIKSIEIKDDQKPVTIMVLDVNLQCSKCYKKVKKLLCKFDEIRDQVYDEKANKVIIKVVCCSPEKIRDKLCSKGGGCIKSIEIKEPPKPKPEPPKPEPPKPEPHKPKPKPPPPTPPCVPVCLPLPPCPPPPGWSPTPRPEAAPDGTKTIVDPPRLPPGTDEHESDSRYLRSAVMGFWCSEGSSHSGVPANPCSSGGPVQYDGYYGRPIYDSWGGGRCDYFSEENQQSCSIM